jgi:hypothetical protein
MDLPSYVWRSKVLAHFPAHQRRYELFELSRGLSGRSSAGVCTRRAGFGCRRAGFGGCRTGGMGWWSGPFVGVAKVAVYEPGLVDRVFRCEVRVEVLLDVLLALGSVHGVDIAARLVAAGNGLSLALWRSFRLFRGRGLWWVILAFRVTLVI